MLGWTGQQKTFPLLSERPVPAVTTFLILLATVALLLSNRVPLEISGFLCLLALVATGTLSYDEAATGFSNGVVITVGAMFVLGGALVRTGVAPPPAPPPAPPLAVRLLKKPKCTFWTKNLYMKSAKNFEALDEWQLI